MAKIISITPKTLNTFKKLFLKHVTHTIYTISRTFKLHNILRRLLKVNFCFLRQCPLVSFNVIQQQFA